MIPKFFSFSLLIICGALLSADTKPNIITIITDDQGWGDVGYNNPKVYTPHLDALARSGKVFTNQYVMPQCTPTRIAAMTGRYPGRFGRAGLQATNAQCFPVGTPTLATVLKNAGYDTYCVGKWHLGAELEDGPNHHGFDHSYGSLAGAIGMYDHRYRVNSPKGVTWHRDLEIIEGYENGLHATDLVAEEAVSVIRKPRDNPFFLYLAFHAPHTPLDERGKFVEQATGLDPTNPTRWQKEDNIKWFNDPDGLIQQEADPQKRLMLAVLYHLDDAIGQVLKALEETGQRENTLILFASDNGPQIKWPGNQYPHDLKLKDFNQPIPMRGEKLDVYEGGIRVPGLVSWPKVIEPGEVNDPVHIIDWLPTLATVVEQPLPELIDGVDLSETLKAGKSLAERPLYWTWHPKIARRALRFGDWKIVQYGRKEPKTVDDFALYNLREDPMEHSNQLAANYAIGEQLFKLYLKEKAQDKR